MMVSKSVPISTLGFPRIGPRRELKTALEDFWSGKSVAQTLLGEAAKLRAARWALQQKLGVTHIPSNDFSLYDHVLDTSAMQQLMRELLKEVVAVAQAQNISLDFAERWEAITGLLRFARTTSFA